MASDPALAHALAVLSYLAGGPAIGVPLALTAGAFAAAIQHERTLPGWLYWLSIVAAVLGVASASRARTDKQQLACLRHIAASGGPAVRVARGEQLGTGQARTPAPVTAPHTLRPGTSQTKDLCSARKAVTRSVESTCSLLVRNGQHAGRDPDGRDFVARGRSARSSERLRSRERDQTGCVTQRRPDPIIRL